MFSATLLRLYARQYSAPVHTGEPSGAKKLAIDQFSLPPLQRRRRAGERPNHSNCQRDSNGNESEEINSLVLFSLACARQWDRKLGCALLAHWAKAQAEPRNAAAAANNNNGHKVAPQNYALPLFLLGDKMRAREKPTGTGARAVLLQLFAAPTCLHFAGIKSGRPTAAKCAPAT